MTTNTNKSDFVTPSCCKKHTIAVMDYKWPVFEEEQEWKVNRVCINCGAHWAGSIGQVKQYTSKEWDKLMEKAS